MYDLWVLESRELSRTFGIRMPNNNEEDVSVSVSFMICAPCQILLGLADKS
jgi:hypothetical protein